MIPRSPCSPGDLTFVTSGGGYWNAATMLRYQFGSGAVYFGYRDTWIDVDRAWFRVGGHDFAGMCRVAGSSAVGEEDVLVSVRGRSGIGR